MSELSKFRLTVMPNGFATFIVDSNAEVKTENYTVIITTDSGKTFVSETNGMVFALPSIAIGNTITFVNMAVDGTAVLSISPATLDGITYAGSSTDNLDLINTKVTAKRGDFVTLASLDGLVSWQVVAVRGIWAKQTV